MASPRHCRLCGAELRGDVDACVSCGATVDGDVHLIDLSAHDDPDSGDRPGSADRPEPGRSVDESDRRRPRRMIRWLVVAAMSAIGVWAAVAFALDDGSSVPEEQSDETASPDPAPSVPPAVISPSGPDVSGSGTTATVSGVPAVDLEVVIATRVGADLVDVATGERRRVVPAGSLGTATPVGLAGRWLIARDGTQTRAVALDTGERLDVAPSDDLLVASAGVATVWRVSAPDDRFDTWRAQLVDLDGSDPQLTVRVPAFTEVVGATTTTVVVEGPGGIFLVDRDGAAELTAGTVRAVSETSILYWGCDADAVCGTGLVDTATRTAIAVDFDVGPVARLAVMTYSPDGEAISWYAFSNSGPLGFEVVELRESERTGVYEPRVSAFPTAWSPDGRWFLYTVDGLLVAYDRSTKTTSHTGIEVPVGNNVGLFVVADTVELEPTG